MSNANTPGSDDGIKEGLGKLTLPVQQADDAGPTMEASPDSAANWDRVKKIGKRTLLAFLLLFITVFGAVAGHFLQNATIRGILWGILKNPGKTITPGGFDWSAQYNLVDHFPPNQRKSLTVLVLGSDHDTVGKRVPGHIAVPVDVPNTPGRSDAIMIARFEFDGDSVSSLNVLSIPRDARVRVPGHGIHKINAAHAYGGPELSCATIRDVFGIDPDYYVDLNFDGFQQVVDAVGGVDINVHQQLDYDDNWGKLHVHLKPGQQHLNGYRAMGYVRIRHTDNDLMRAQRQHEFIEALKTRVTSPSAFLMLPNAMSAITNNMHSNLSIDQMLTLANLARKAPKDAVYLETLPVTEGKTFVYIDRRKSVGLIRKMFFKDKQVADLSIKTPDNEVAPPRHRKRHLKDSGGTAEPRHRALQQDTTSDSGVRLDANDAPPSIEDAGPQPSTERPDKPDASDKPAPADSPKGDSTTGSDGGKSPPAKGKDGTGTSSGSTSTPIRI